MIILTIYTIVFHTQYEIIAEKARIKAEKLAARAASKESDDEDEDEEEEEPVDEDDLPPKPVHPFVTQVQSLQGEIHSTLFLLLAHPLPETDIYDIASAIVGEIAESVVDHHEAALVTCELAQMVQNSGVVIPNLPSPFASPEGAAAWAHALAQTSHIAEPEGDKKKAPPKPAKGALPPSEPTKQQIDFFYKLVYDGVRTSFLDNSVALFNRVDERLQRDAVVPLKQYNTSLENLFHVASLRAEDCEAGGKVAFVSFHGSAFTDQASVLSAFDVKQSNKVQAVAPVLKLAEFGAKAIVLVYESPSTLATSTTDALLPYFDEIKALIAQQRAEYVIKTTKALRKLKQKPPVFKELTFFKYASFAEFYFHADALLKNTPTQSIPIILIENVLVTGVVPPEPVFVEEESDDEAAPVSLGVEESSLKKRRDFDARRPHRVLVTLDLTAPQPGVPKRTAGSNMPPSVRINVYADAAAAIVEAYGSVVGTSNGAPLWVDGTQCKLFDPASVLPALDRSKITTRFASEDVREACLWAGVLQLLPQSVDYLNAVPDETAPAVVSDSNSDAIETSQIVAPTGKELIAQHFAQLFPYSAVVKKAPKAVVVLGGSIRADKFAALDQLIDLVRVFFKYFSLSLFLLLTFMFSSLLRSTPYFWLASLRCRSCASPDASFSRSTPSPVHNITLCAARSSQKPGCAVASCAGPLTC